MGNWESVFKDKGKFFHKPHKDVVKLVKLLKQNQVNEVLDLGCGSGRHAVFLAKNGFDVYGMDNSKSGLDHTRKWLKKESLTAKLKKANCYEKYPYKDNFFDAVISVQVIHHAVIKDIEFCISEIKRCLKPGGIVFVTVPKTKKNKFRSKIKMIAPRTFVPLDGLEVGTPHYHFNKSKLRECFKDFNLLDLYVDELKHYCFLGRLKNSNN